MPEQFSIEQALQLAVQHHGAGRLPEAEEIYRQILQADPNHCDALHLLGVIAQQVGNFDVAVDLITEALAIKPDFAEAHNNLGNTLLKMDRLEEAVKSYQKALANKPDYVDAHFNLGVALDGQGRAEEAAESYRRALTLKPDYVEALNNLGAALKGLGKLDEALASYNRALALKPDFAEAHNSIGAVFHESNQLDQAVACFSRALAIKADFADAHYNLGNTLKSQNKLNEALASYQKALELAPRSLRFAIGAHLFLPIILPSPDAVDEWRGRYQSGLEFLQNFAGSHGGQSEPMYLDDFYLAYHNQNNCLLKANLCRFSRARFDFLNVTALTLSTWRPPAAAAQHIKVGIVSEYLCDHTIGKVTIGLIQHLNRKRFDVVVFHTPKTKHDSYRLKIDALADKSVTLPHGTKNQQDAIILENLDVLFYPDIGMTPSTYALAFARLAPVQATSWGHPDTTGLDTMDYFISAQGIEPNDADEHYTERLISLPKLPCFYHPPDVSFEMPKRRDIGLPEGKTLYCCPQSLFKIHPDFDGVLAAIAEGDPDGCIVLLEGRVSSWADSLRDRWARAAPILLKRTLFLPRSLPVSRPEHLMPYERFLALMSHADVQLDPIHFGGGNSMYEAMVFGTPAVTWPGQFMRSRILAGMYAQMGVADAPIAENIGDYAALALALGRDPERRRTLREALQQAARRELFSDRQTVRDIEVFFEAAIAAAGKGQRLPAGWKPNA